MTFSVARLVSLILLAAAFAMPAGDAMAQRVGRDHGDRQGRTDQGRADTDRPDSAGTRADRHDRREDYRALSDAVRRVERRTGGQVLSAERVPYDGRDVNRVKVVDSSGRVRVYMDDPAKPERDHD